MTKTIKKTESISIGDIVYHKLTGQKMIVTNAAPANTFKGGKSFHCRWSDTRGDYFGKVFQEVELSHSRPPTEEESPSSEPYRDDR